MPGDFPDAPRRVIVTRGIVNGVLGLFAAIFQIIFESADLYSSARPSHLIRPRLLSRSMARQELAMSIVPICAFQ